MLPNAKTSMLRLALKYQVPYHEVLWRNTIDLFLLQALRITEGVVDNTKELLNINCEPCGPPYFLLISGWRV